MSISDFIPAVIAIMGAIIIALFIISIRRFCKTPSDDKRIAEKALTMVVLMIFSLVPLTLWFGGIFEVISYGVESYMKTIVWNDMEDFMEFLMDSMMLLFVPVMTIAMTILSALINLKIPVDNPSRKKAGKVMGLMVFIAVINALICVAILASASKHYEMPAMTL